MKRVFLTNPLVQLNTGEKIHFLRDYMGGELPTSMVYPPLDAAYTAALLRANGINVTLVDASTLNIPPGRLAGMVSGEQPDFIGIPSTWGSIAFDIALARDFKKILPSAKIVVWGTNVTVNPEPALSSGYIDYVILGEPEKPFLDIVNDTFDENVAYAVNGKIVSGKHSLLQDLDWLPFPARDMLPNNRYVAPYVRQNPFATLATSRGCPYSKCTFCPTNIWYMNQVRYRSVENVLREIDEIVGKFGIRSIIFRDQSLTSEKERLIRICEGIAGRQYRLSWRCFSGVGIVDEELLAIMKKAGCYQINYGFESGSQRVLDMNNKGITLEQSEKASRLTREAGIEVSGSFMLGMFGDTEETIEETIRLAIQSVDYAEFLMATPLPSTKFYEECRLPDSAAAGLFPRWHNRVCDSPMLLETDFLHQKIKEAYRKFYFRPAYIFKRLQSTASVRQMALQLKTGAALFAAAIEK